VKKLKKQSEIHIPFLTTSFEKISPLLFKLSHLTQSGFKHFPVYFSSYLMFANAVIAFAGTRSSSNNSHTLADLLITTKYRMNQKEVPTLFSKDIAPGRNVEEQSRRGLLLGP
jgi:hypothetical protein